MSNYLEMLSEIKYPKGYGRAIPIIAMELIRSFFKEKRFYIAVFYYVVIPIFLVLVASAQPAIQTGTGIAIYFAQLNSTNYVKTLFLSFFPGQIFLVILSADQIASEYEQDTYPLLYSKPVYESEIIIGKYLGLLGVISLLEAPTLMIIYYSNLVKYSADGVYPYISALDELIIMIIIVILLQGVIIGLSIGISAIFSRSLYAILTSILSLFVISTASDIISGISSDGANYLSFNWLIDAVLPEVFFNLEKLDNGLQLLPFLGTLTLIIGAIILVSTMVIRKKEVF